MQQIYEQKRMQIERGRDIWLALERDYSQIQETYVFIFPEADSKCAEDVFHMLPEFIEQKNIKKYYLISCDDRSFKRVENPDYTECIEIPMGRQQIEDIIAYYMFDCFGKNIIIVSLDCPDGRNGSWLNGVKSITLEDVVSLGILNL